MAYPYHLESFLKGYLLSQGAVADQPDYATLELLVEGKLASNLGKKHLVLAFDYDAFQETPGSEYISYGNGLLESVMQMAVKNHTSVLRYVTPSGALPAQMDRRIARFLNSRAVVALTHSKQYWARVIRFQFKVAFLTEQREEELTQIWVDALSAREMKSYASLKHIFFDESPAKLLPELSPNSLSQLFACAHEALHAAIKPRLRQLEERLNGHLRADLARTESYFTSMIADSQARLARAQMNADEKQIVDTQNRLNAIELQKRHHMQDVQARYGVRCQSTLLDTVTYLVPRWRIKYRLPSRSLKDEASCKVVWWDELLKIFV